MMLTAVVLTACNNAGKQNAETAIEGCSGENIQQVNIDMEKKEVQLYVSKAAELTQLEVQFDLTDGATIQPKNLLPQDNPPYYDFSKTVEGKRFFTVVSENGLWESTYQISAWQMELPKHFGFERLAAAPYHVITDDYSSDNVIRRLQWCSGNRGFQMRGLAKSITDYPTTQAKGGVLETEHCVKLQTMSNGEQGIEEGMPIASGSLFIGSFDLAYMNKDVKKAMKLGETFYEKPVRMTGWYKYRPGEVFTNSRGKVMKEKTDACEICAVLFETSERVQHLDGRNFLKAKNIVSIARNPEQVKATGEWTRFELPFVENGRKKIDRKKLAAGKYKLAVVFASSVDGGNFEGAVGSTLYIDEVHIDVE